MGRGDIIRKMMSLGREQSPRSLGRIFWTAVGAPYVTSLAPLGHVHHQRAPRYCLLERAPNLRDYRKTFYA